MTQYQIINNGANNSNQILGYKKQLLWDSINKLRKLEREISELETAK